MRFDVIRALKASVIFALMLLMTACGSSQPRAPLPSDRAQAVKPQPKQRRPYADFEGLSFGDIRIALLAPVSGPQARIGETLVNAAELALFDAYDPRLKLKVYDTKSLPSDAAAAAAAAIEDGAQVILGPLFAPSVEAVTPIAQRAHVPVLAFSNDANMAAPGTYILGFQPTDEVRRVLSYAIEGKHLTRLAALIPEGQYGDRVLRSLSDVARMSRAELRAVEIYPPDPQSLSQHVRRLAQYDRRHLWLEQEKQFLAGLNDDMSQEFLNRLDGKETLGEVGYDLVLIAEGGSLLRTLAPLLPIYEVLPQDVQFAGTGLFNDEGLRREPPLHGAWFAAPSPDAFKGFAERYRETFGRAPAQIAGISYDAMALAAILARGEIPEERFSHKAITDPNGFAGVSGLFRLRGDGVVERGLAIMQIKPEGLEEIDPAPKNFVDRVIIGAGQPAAHVAGAGAKLKALPSLSPAASQ